jgi:hypothetical protein
MSKSIPNPRPVGKGITKAGSSKSIGKLAGTSKTNYVKGKNYFIKGDKTVKVPKVADTNSADGGGLRNLSPMTDGRQFTGNSFPKADENLKTKSDVVKVILWEPTKTLKKASGKPKFIKSSK